MIKQTIHCMHGYIVAFLNMLRCLGLDSLLKRPVDSGLHKSNLDQRL